MTFNLSTVIAVGSGGFLGAISRFFIGIQVVKYFPHQLPLATLGVNVLGSFIIGLLVGLFLHFTPSNELKGFLVIGFLGAFTTYSSFAIESYMLINSSFWYGILNILLNVVGTIVSAGLGYKLIFYFLK